jgi:protein SCO1/2
MKLIKKIIILAMILALPGFLYYLLTAYGKNRYTPLQVYGPKVVAKTSHKVGSKVIPDTIYHQLNDFNLKDQDGRPVSFKTFNKKIFVVNFFYTSCPTLCNQVNTNLDSLAANYAKNKMIYFVSITVDPYHDSEAILKSYSDKVKPKLGNRLFLNGDTSVIYNLARKGLLVDALQSGKDSLVLIAEELRKNDKPLY